MRLLIMGPQGVGKGTQAALLSKHYNIPAISTGDIFRYNLKNHTELGKQAQAYIDKGELVPDELTNSIVKDRLAKDATVGFLTGIRVTPRRSRRSTRCLTSWELPWIMLSRSTRRRMSCWNA